MIRQVTLAVAGICFLSLIHPVAIFAAHLKPVDPKSLAAPSRKPLELANSKKLSEAVNPHLRALDAAAVGPRYVFRFFAFGIFNTRSKHNDTDYVACGLSVNGTKFPAIVKPMGDLNNGIYQVNLDFPPITVDAGTKVVYNFSIINDGHGDPSQVQNAISTGTGEALDQLDIGEPWSSIANAAVALGNVLLFANCDGVVVSDQISLTGAEIMQKVPQGFLDFHASYAGADSPSGCGSNSQYDATWAIIHL